jgi:hypothetical protein
MPCVVSDVSPTWAWVACWREVFRAPIHVPKDGPRSCPSCHPGERRGTTVVWCLLARPPTSAPPPWRAACRAGAPRCGNFGSATDPTRCAPSSVRICNIVEALVVLPSRSQLSVLSSPRPTCPLPSMYIFRSARLPICLLRLASRPCSDAVHSRGAPVF